MRVNVGANWQIRHLTDRVVELVKDDVAYRQLTGRDGYVRIRIEPQESRSHALDRAIRMAEQNDALLGLKLGERLLPATFAQEERVRTGKTGIVISMGGSVALPLEQYRKQQRRLARAFATKDQEPERRRYRV